MRATRRPRRGLDAPGRRFTERGRALVAAGLLLTAAGMALGLPDLTRVGAATLALPMLSRLWLALARPRVSVRRTLSPAVLSAGEEGRVDLRVGAAGRWRPTPLVVVDRAEPPLGPGAQLGLWRTDDGARAASYELHPRRRGLHLLGPAQLHTRDALGLTTAVAQAGPADELVVLPRVSPLQGAPLHRGARSGSGTAAVVVVGGEHDPAVRDYRRGDDTRFVHWGATAHRGRLMVRQESAPRARHRVVLVLDDEAGHWGRAAADGTRADLEWAVEFLASAAAHLDGLGYPLTLLTGEGDAPGGAESLRHVLRGLALARPRRRADGAALVRRGRAVAGDEGLVIVATGAGARPDLLAPLRAGLGLALVALPPGPPGEGARELRDRATRAGWGVTLATPDLSPAQAWTALVEPTVGARR